MDRRFDTEFDTPCPFRLARFGYKRIGEFRPPKKGEMFILPTAGPQLQEHEPIILGACQDMDVAHHIVEAVPEGYEPSAVDVLMDIFGALVGPDPEEGEAA